MNCRKVRCFLSAFIDAELRGHEHQLVNAHLSACRSCHEEYERLLHLKRLIGRMAVRECAPDLASRINQHTRERGSLLPPNLRALVTDRSILLLKVTGSTAALAVAALVWWVNLGATRSHRIVFQEGGTVIYDMPAPARSESDLTGPGMDVSLLELAAPTASLPDTAPSTGADTPWASDEASITTPPTSRPTHSTFVWKRLSQLP